MQQDKHPSHLERASIIIASFFSVGHAPFAPGTCGSVAAIIPLYFLSYTGFLTSLCIVVALTILGTIAVKRSITNKQDHDPSWIVIDEVVGVLTLYPCCLYFIGFNTLTVIASLTIFRVLDISKLGPVGYVDRKFSNALGVMLDDIVAAVITAAIMICLQYIITFL